MLGRVFRGFLFPKFEFEVAGVQVYRTIDQGASAADVRTRIRSRFGSIHGGKLTPHHYGILDVIASAAALSSRAVGPSGINLSEKIMGQALLDGESTARSNIATAFLIAALSDALPSMREHLSILVINNTYLVPVVRTDTSRESEGIGYDVGNPENLRVYVDPEFAWVKRKYSGVTSVAFDQGQILAHILDVGSPNRGTAR